VTLSRWHGSRADSKSHEENEMSYFTILIKDERGWRDEIGFETKKEAKSEIEFVYYNVKKKNIAIIETDGSLGQLIHKLKELNK
jgi:hypothetical protein